MGRVLKVKEGFWPEVKSDDQITVQGWTGVPVQDLGGGGTVGSGRLDLKWHPTLDTSNMRQVWLPSMPFSFQLYQLKPHTSKRSFIGMFYGM